MAERRMMAKSIIKSDQFLDMPATTQNLYFHMLLDADDDGFVNAPKSIMRIVGAKEDDMKLLIAKQFVIGFGSGVIVIKHWKIHNYIQSDRYKPSIQPERKLLEITANKEYQLNTDHVSTMDNLACLCVYCHVPIAHGVFAKEVRKRLQEIVKERNDEYEKN